MGDFLISRVLCVSTKRNQKKFGWLKNSFESGETKGEIGGFSNLETVMRFNAITNRVSLKSALEPGETLKESGGSSYLRSATCFNAERAKKVCLAPKFRRTWLNDGAQCGNSLRSPQRYAF